MDLGHELADALVELQEAAESRMSEHFIIDFPTGTEIDDEGREQTTYTLVYDGIGRIRTYRPHEQNPDVGSGTITVQRTDWHLPVPERMEYLMAQGLVSHWAGPVMAGARARRVTPGKPPKTVRIAGEHDATDSTAQRLVVDEITGGVWS